MRFPRRGAYRQNSFAFSTSFPFGFLEKSARVTLRREMIGLSLHRSAAGFRGPAASGIAGEIETHYRGLGKDFYRIRPYEAFESARHVDWKASAHVGSLQVREFAREQEQTVEMFLDRDIPPELDAWFEHAIDCCAFLAWRLSNQGAAIHFRSNGFDFRQPEDGDIYTYSEVPGSGLSAGGYSPEAPLDDTQLQNRLHALAPPLQRSRLDGSTHSGSRRFVCTASRRSNYRELERMVLPAVSRASSRC